MIRAVIFDMDGVLMESEKIGLKATQRTFRAHGKHVKPADVLPFIGAGTRAYVEGLARLYSLHEDVETLIEERRKEYERIIRNTGMPVRPGALKLLESCHFLGLKTALASSSSPHKIRINLKAAKIPRRVFNAILSGTTVSKMKPFPDIFLAAARKLRVKPSECIVIEDAEKGIMGARSARMHAIAVTGTFTSDRLKKAGARIVVTDRALPSACRKLVSGLSRKV